MCPRPGLWVDSCGIKVKILSDIITLASPAFYTLTQKWLWCFWTEPKVKAESLQCSCWGGAGSQILTAHCVIAIVEIRVISSCAAASAFLYFDGAAQLNFEKLIKERRANQSPGETWRAQTDSGSPDRSRRHSSFHSQAGGGGSVHVNVRYLQMQIPCEASRMNPSLHTQL